MELQKRQRKILIFSKEMSQYSSPRRNSHARILRVVDLGGCFRGWRVPDREARTFKLSPPRFFRSWESPRLCSLSLSLSLSFFLSSFCRGIRRVFGLGRKVAAKLSTLFAFLRKTRGRPGERKRTSLWRTIGDGRVIFEKKKKKKKNFSTRGSSKVLSRAASDETVRSV